MLSLIALLKRASLSPRTTIRNSALGTPTVILDAAISQSTTLGVHLASLLSMTHVVKQVALVIPLQELRYLWVTPQVIMVLRSFRQLNQPIGKLVPQLKLVGL
jgi:hypothetical protein